MKPTNYLLIFMLAVIGLLLFTVFYFKNRADKAEAAKDRSNSIIREKNDSLTYVKNELGRIVATKPAATVNTDELKEYYSAEIDKLRKEFEIKTKDIKAIVVAGFQAKGEGAATLTPVEVTNEDGTTEELTDYVATDKFLTFKSRIFTGESTAPFSYTYTDELTFAFHTKKDHWWSKEKLYGSGSLLNPNAKITKATEVMVDNYKDKRWGIGFSAGYGAVVIDSEVKVGPMIQVGVSYDVIKF